MAALIRSRWVGRGTESAYASSVSTSRPPRSRVKKGSTNVRRRGMSASISVHLRVNGVDHELAVEPRLLLVHALRDHLGLTGTHVGCDTSNCGACTVHLDGRAVKSCTVLAVQADDVEITTIEGMAAENGELHPLQEAF